MKKIGLLKRCLGIFLGCLFLSSFSLKASDVLNESHIRSDQKAELPYNLLHFTSSNSKKKYPLILVLQGSGMNGDRCFNLWKETGETQGVMILAPIRKKGQIAKDQLVASHRALLYQVMAEYPVDSERIYIAGVSSGGLIARWLLDAERKLFQGVAFMAYSPPSRWIQEANAKELPPLLIVLGEKDIQFPPPQVRQNVEKLMELGAKVKFLVDKSARHEYKNEWNVLIMDWIQSIER